MQKKEEKKTSCQDRKQSIELNQEKAQMLNLPNTDLKISMIKS